MNQAVRERNASPAGHSRITIDSAPATTSGATTTLTMPSGTLTPGPVGVAGGHSNKSVENAVYAHIRAVRALGRTQINTTEIASALGLPVATVDETIEALRKKGIKLVE